MELVTARAPTRAACCCIIALQLLAGTLHKDFTRRLRGRAGGPGGKPDGPQAANHRPQPLTDHSALSFSCLALSFSCQRHVEYLKLPPETRAAPPSQASQGGLSRARAWRVRFAPPPPPPSPTNAHPPMYFSQPQTCVIPRRTGAAGTSSTARRPAQSGVTLRQVSCSAARFLRFNVINFTGCKRVDPSCRPRTAPFFRPPPQVPCPARPWPS